MFISLLLSSNLLTLECRVVRSSAEAAVISGGGKSGCFAKCCRERTSFAEAQGQSDVRYRACRIGQQNLGALDASAGVIPMRRHAKGLLESPTEVVRAEASKLRKRGERNLLGKVFLDVGDHDPLLPSGEPAADRRYAAGRPGIEPHQLMRQHDTESVEIQPICRKRAFDQGHEFERRTPERRILEEQSRSKGDLRKAEFRIDCQLGRIEIEICYAR